MRILFLSNGLRLGGVEMNLVRLTRELVSRGHEVVVASGEGVLVEEIALAGATHIPLKTKGGRLAAAPADLRALRRRVRDVRPDIIQVFSASSASLLWLSRGLGLLPSGGVRPLPVVGTLLGLQNSPEESPIRIMMRAYASTLGTDLLIASAPSIEAAFRRVAISRRRLVRMEAVGIPIPARRPVPVRQAAELRRELGVDEGDIVITTIGNLVPSKSHHLLVAAATQVVAQRPDARFFIVGEGALRASLQQQIADNGLQHHMVLLGQRTDAARVLAATDVYVRPGIVEGLAGITVLEAQALEVPVVTFDTMDVRVAVTHMETGWIVPTGDSDALAGAIIRLMDDKALARSLGRAGREQVELRFSISAVVDGLESLYGELLDRRPAPSLRGAVGVRPRRSAGGVFGRRP